jgi:hypothetical protein
MSAPGVACPRCGAINLGTRFCESCGLEASVSAPTVSVRRSERLYAIATRVVALGLVVAPLMSTLIPSILYLAFEIDAYGYDVASQILVRVLPLGVSCAAIIVAGVTSGRSAGVVVGASVLGVLGSILFGNFGYGMFGLESLSIAIRLVGAVLLFLWWALIRPVRSYGYHAIWLVVGLVVVQFLVAFVLPWSWYYDGGIAVVALTAIAMAAVHAVGVFVVTKAAVVWGRRARPTYPATHPGMNVVQASTSPGGAGYLVMPDRTNTLAVLALIFGLLSGTVIPIVLGHIALSQIRRSGERGAGLATAGLVLGYVWTAIVVILLIWYFSVLGVLLR